MDKTVQVDVFIKNVKRFVKKCRDKNQELLKFNHLHPVDDEKDFNENTWEHSVFEKYLKNNSSFFSDKSNDDKKVDGYMKFESLYVKPNEEEGNTSAADYVIHSPIKDYIKSININTNKDIENTNILTTTNNNNNNEEESLQDKENYLLKKNSSIIISHKDNDNCNNISGEKQSSLEQPGEGANEKTKKNALETLRSEIIEEDLELLRMYNKLEKSSHTLMLTKSKKLGKKKTIQSKQFVSKNSETKTTKKKKVKKVKKIPLLNLKSEKSVNFTDDVQKKNSKILKAGNVSSSNNVTSRLSKKASLLNESKYISLKSSSNSSNIVSSIVSSKKATQPSLSKMVSKKSTDRMISFHEGLKNRLLKKSENNSSFNIGCMYIKNDISESEWNTFRKYAKTKHSKYFKSTEKSSGTFRNKKNCSGQFLSHNKNFENSFRRSKSRKEKCSEDIMTIINGLLKDYVPKLIARYDSCLYNINKENAILKKKIRESLDFGDLQYEEIRELKMQVVHLNNKNKKMNDIITTMKEKISNAEELDAKNLEYLDEIMILKNKIYFLERVIEENDYTKKGIQLKQIRHNVKVMYNNLRNQMKYIKILKNKYKRKNGKKKFSIKKYLRLSEYPTKLLSLDDLSEIDKESRKFSHCFLDEEILISKESFCIKEKQEKDFQNEKDINNSSNENCIDNKDETVIEPNELDNDEDDENYDKREIITKQNNEDNEEDTNENKNIEINKFSYAMSNIELETLLIFDNFFKLLMKGKDENKRKHILKSLPKKMHHFCKYLSEYSESLEKEDIDKSTNEIKESEKEIKDEINENIIINNQIQKKVILYNIEHYRNLRFEGLDKQNKYTLTKSNINKNTKNIKLLKEDLSSLKCLEKLKKCLCNNLTCCPVMSDISINESSENINILLNNIKKNENILKNQKECEEKKYIKKNYEIQNILPKDYSIEVLNLENNYSNIKKPSTRVYENMKIFESYKNQNNYNYYNYYNNNNKTILNNNSNNHNRKITQCSIQNINNYKPLLKPNQYNQLNYRQRNNSMNNNMKIQNFNLL